MTMTTKEDFTAMGQLEFCLLSKACSSTLLKKTTPSISCIRAVNFPYHSMSTDGPCYIWAIDLVGNK